MGTSLVDEGFRGTTLRLICYTLHGQKPEIRPAPVEREWMDRSPDAFAYRCLPLDIANVHGWEVLCPAPFEASWNGDNSPVGVKVISDAPPHLLPISHFGSGILTFHLHGLFRTEAGVQLWVSGSPNRLKDGIQPLSGIIETDWAPYTFTMNWRFTRQGTIRFEKDEPFCFFFPLQIDLLENVVPEFAPISTDPATERAFREWSQSRQGFNRDLKDEGTKARTDKWQKTYFRGQMPDGNRSAVQHRTKLRVAPFKDSSGS